MRKELKTWVNAKITEVLEEEREKERKKLNLVLVNLKEADGHSVEEKKKAEIEQVEEIFKDILPEDTTVEVKDPIRLGQKNAGNRPRLLRVTVSNEETKKEILRNTNKLKAVEKDPRNRLYINPDYTQKERETNNKLRKELKDRMAKGEKDIMIDFSKKEVVKRQVDEDRRDRSKDEY